MIIVRVYIVVYRHTSISLHNPRWELQNRAWLPPIDRQAHGTHAQFFLPINFSANSTPQLTLDFIGCVNQSVNLISYVHYAKKNANQ